MKLRSALMLALCLLPALATAGHYGEAFPQGEAVAIDVAAAKASEHVGKPALYAGRVTEVCQKEGCWLVIENNGQAARVMVKDHAFAMPKDASGSATVYGVLSEKILDDKAARHLAEDAGRSEPVARRELRIVATAVAIAD